jgi:Fe-S cluster assembly iron-binding protein IscA
LGSHTHSPISRAKAYHWRFANVAASWGLQPLLRTKVEKVQDMLTVTKRAALLLKAAKNAEGAANNAGIRILKSAEAAESEKPTVGLAFADAPYPDDKEFEQQGLRIFVEDALIELLDDRILDVSEGYEGPELVLR